MSGMLSATTLTGAGVMKTPYLRDVDTCGRQRLERCAIGRSVGLFFKEYQGSRQRRSRRPRWRRARSGRLVRRFKEVLL